MNKKLLPFFESISIEFRGSNDPVSGLGCKSWKKAFYTISLCVQKLKHIKAGYRLTAMLEGKAPQELLPKSNSNWVRRNVHVEKLVVR